MYIINVDITEIDVIDISTVFECITSYEFGFVFVTNQPADGLSRIILRWLGNFVVLCQNDVICAFHSSKTLEMILVVFISAGMVENSQNGDSRSFN